MRLERFSRSLHRRGEHRQTLLALALVTLRTRDEAERLRRAHASVLALYNEREHELARLRRRVRELEDAPRAAPVRAA